MDDVDDEELRQMAESLERAVEAASGVLERLLPVFRQKYGRTIGFAVVVGMPNGPVAASANMEPQDAIRLCTLALESETAADAYQAAPKVRPQ